MNICWNQIYIFKIFILRSFIFQFILGLFLVIISIIFKYKKFWVCFKTPEISLNYIMKDFIKSISEFLMIFFRSTKLLFLIKYHLIYYLANKTNVKSKSASWHSLLYFSKITFEKSIFLNYILVCTFIEWTIRRSILFLIILRIIIF